ncbi:ABC transporter substrate-binding protein [Candidatus Clostridium radicumherbarum]|uniref:ABC transporter substrate-binding protein n=1 Tax=Candidatus Clostridium radicumherbarum TaxID=3381662 RepID=A0ABW8TNC9_9CLOT
MKKLKITRVLIIMLLVGAAILTGCSKAGAKVTNSKSNVKIGISQIAEFTALDDNRKGFIKALEDNGYKEGTNLEIDYQNAQGDLTISQTIAKQFASQNKDLIYAIATPSAQGAYNATKKIPILISAVTDPVAAGIVKSLKEPNTNVSGTSDYLPVAKQLDLIKMFIPKAKKIGVLYNTSEINSEVQVNQLKDYGSKNGYEVFSVGVTSTNEINQAIGSLLDKIDVLYVPTDNLVVSAMPMVVKKTLEKKIPVIASESGSVEAGALATQGIDYYKLGYKTGEMAVKVLKGDDISKMPIANADETKIIVNEDTLKSLSLVKPDNKDIVYVKSK